jgi:signal transduction histidine kinase
MGEMMGAIAHQWRQPITAIASAAMSMRMKWELGALEEAQFFSGMESIERQTQRMSQTINDFMNFFKPSKEMQRFNVRQMLSEIYGLLSAQFVYRGIEFINDIPRQMELCGYRSELEQVVLNLLANARDAFEEREQSDRWVRIYPSLYAEKIDLVIEDNAGGIDEKLLDRVCEPYFTTKETGKGTGIGLYMSKSIMQNSFHGDLVPKNRYNEKGERTGALFVMAIGRDHLDCQRRCCSHEEVGDDRV